MVKFNYNNNIATVKHKVEVTKTKNGANINFKQSNDKQKIQINWYRKKKTILTIMNEIRKSCLKSLFSFLANFPRMTREHDNATADNNFRANLRRTY